MDENRLHDKLDRIAESVAEIRSDVKNQYQYISAVNSNQKETAKLLQDHRDSIEAHGVIAGRRTTDVYVKWFTLALSSIGVLLGLKKSVDH